MAVKIVGAGATVPAPRGANDSVVKLDQIEAFGRLNLSHRLISLYYDLTLSQTRYLLKKPEVAAAFARGRAETTIAVRQKQLQMALAGNTQMLLHAGVQFAEQTMDGPALDVDDFEPSRFSWDTNLKEKLEAARAELIDGVATEVEDGG